MPSIAPFDAIARRLGGRLVGHRRLTGGVSASVSALDIADADGHIDRVVVRQHALDGPRAVAPGVTAAEHRLLGALGDRGLPVPRPILFDESCAVLPGPFIVMPFVDGTTEVAPESLPAALAAMADFMARLHRLDVETLDLLPLPARVDPAPGALKYLPKAARFDPVRQRLERWTVAAHARVVLHGDFWSGNILWRDGRIAAVLDWEDAAIGDPLADVAGCRNELAWAHGPEAGDAFTRHYVAASGRAVDPVALAAWELYTASAGLTYLPSWGLDAPLEVRIERAWRGCVDRAAGRFLGEP